MFLLDVNIWAIHTYLNMQQKSNSLKAPFPGLNYIETVFPAIWLKAYIVCSLDWVFYFNLKYSFTANSGLYDHFSEPKILVLFEIQFWEHSCSPIFNCCCIFILWNTGTRISKMSKILARGLIHSISFSFRSVASLLGQRMWLPCSCMSPHWFSQQIAKGTLQW